MNKLKFQNVHPLSSGLFMVDYVLIHITFVGTGDIFFF